MIATKAAAPDKSHWEAQKVKLKVIFPQLTDVDLNFDETRRHETLSKLQVKLGTSTKELKSIIDTR